ncbi:helix-turn-helix transcriptional regulator [Paenalcaligenes sp. Me52]|uniref:S24 family peptidase n=1 Tax=Paenalcaligenes sp. Me52 TaxID=3392038 RepID=UPI003D2BE5A4
MKTVEETRLERLKELIQKHESAAALNRAAGRNERDSTFSQLINGSLNSKTQKPKTMGSDLARQLEESLGLPRGWMDTPETLTAGVDASRLAAKSTHHNSVSKNADIAIFERLDVRAACGSGIGNSDYPEVLSTMSMPIGMAQKMLGTTNKANSVKIVMASRDSMVPTINPDDLLFVDVSVNEYVSEGVYLLVHDKDLVCKRLSRPGRDVMVTSDNNKYPSWKWSERPEDTRIVGRVIRALPIQFKNFGGE